MPSSSSNLKVTVSKESSSGTKDTTFSQFCMKLASPGMFNTGSSLSGIHNIQGSESQYRESTPQNKFNNLKQGEQSIEVAKRERIISFEVCGLMKKYSAQPPQEANPFAFCNVPDDAPDSK